MREFIQQLESRTLFSATADMLVADLGAIKVDIAAVKAALLNSAATYKAELQQLAADLKAAGGADNLALARKLRHDAAQTFAVLRQATGKMSGALNSASNRATAHGLALLLKSSAQAIAKVQADVAALNAVMSQSGAQFSTALGANTVADDITVAGTNNSSDATITADVEQLTNAQATFTTFLTAAQKLVTDTTTLATDLGTLTV